MNAQDKFADIRPYHPSEVPPAVARMTKSPQFQIAVEYLFNEPERQEIYKDLAKVKSGFEFQKVFMYKAINRVLELSSDGLSITKVSNLKNNGPSVLLSNHRDILLDSAMLQVVLVDQAMETSEITFGSNLIFNDFILDFGKVNRMFTVYRGGNPREVLGHSKLLSEYMHHTIRNKKVSAWIAQRKGRTKDGLDKTDTAVLKMLTMFDRKNPVEAFLSLNILPIAVSYEWEPCDFTKIREMYISKKQEYIKKPNEDFTSVVNGIIKPKGKINLAFGLPVNEFINNNIHHLNKQNIYQEITEYIDRQVYENYKLYPNNYYAYDSLNGTKEYVDKYDLETEKQMVERIGALYEIMDEKSEEIKSLYLSLYAGPIVQKKSILGMV